jgi:hypothetical protein
MRFNHETNEKNKKEGRMNATANLTNQRELRNEGPFANRQMIEIPHSRGLA